MLVVVHFWQTVLLSLPAHRNDTDDDLASKGYLPSQTKMLEGSDISQYIYWLPELAYIINNA